MHHPLALVGTIYQLYYKIGGGLMSILMVDTITCLLSMPQLVLWKLRVRQFSKRLYHLETYTLPLLEHIAALLIRSIMYTAVCTWTIYQLWLVRWPDVDQVWTGMVTIWSIFAFWAHAKATIHDIIPCLKRLLLTDEAIPKHD